MAVGILEQKLNELVAERDRLYTEQLQPLDHAIEQLRTIVTPLNGKGSASATTETNGSAKPRRARRTSVAKSAPEKSTRAPGRKGRPPKGEAPTDSKAKKEKPAPAKKTTVKLKGAYRGKSVDEAVVELFGSDPTKTWSVDSLVGEITSPANKAERATYVRSLRLSLANGAGQGKWKKISDGPAVYASNDYQV